MAQLSQHMRTHHPRMSPNSARNILRANRSLKNVQTLRRELNTPGSPFYRVPKDLARTHLSPYLSGYHGSLNEQEESLRERIRRSRNVRGGRKSRRTRRTRKIEA
jgi:hypothetical protein